MATTFDPIPTAESWQLSNAPILSIATLRASLDIIDRAGGMRALRQKTERQIEFFDRRLAESLGDRINCITPQPLHERGCQYALRVTNGDGKRVYEELEKARVLCDWREPDVIRVAPVPLYNSFDDIDRFVNILDGIVR
jgi:kynureninase